MSLLCAFDLMMESSDSEEDMILEEVEDLESEDDDLLIDAIPRCIHFEMWTNRVDESAFTINKYRWKKLLAKHDKICRGTSSSCTTPRNSRIV